jgi:hypothetical protein
MTFCIRSTSMILLEHNILDASLKLLVVGHIYEMSLFRGPSASRTSLPENLSHAKPDGNYRVSHYRLT